jgi:hypothetical protein
MLISTNNHSILKYSTPIRFTVLLLTPVAETVLLMLIPLSRQAFTFGHFSTKDSLSLFLAPFSELWAEKVTL